MKILHVLSNWKWTERAEPAADAAVGQAMAGAAVLFACGRAPAGVKDAVEHRARARGLDPLVFNLTKHLRPFAALQDVPALRRLLDGQGVDVVHSHMTNGHLIAGVAARLSRRRPAVVSTCYEPEGPGAGARSRFLMRRLTDGLVVIADEARRRAVEEFGVAPGRVAVIEPGVDVDRFQTPLLAEEARRSFGLDPGCLVIGLVSRIRRSRRIDIAIEALARLAGRFPTLRLMVVGRGSGNALEEEVLKPAAALGVGDRALAVGYCRDERLVAAYRAMDALVYPFPGTDKSCRTVREALAAGVPVVASRVGYLPALVRDGITGRVVEPEAEAFAAALEPFLADRAQREAAGRRAAEDARSRFSLRAQGLRHLGFYERIRGGLREGRA